MKAAESTRGYTARGILITPHDGVDDTAAARLDRVRLLRCQDFAGQAVRLLDVLREYRRGWSDDAATRAERRTAVVGDLPAADWLWQAIEDSTEWVEPETLNRAWCGRATA